MNILSIQKKLSLLLFCLNLYAPIIEIHHIAQVLEYAHPGMLVLWDIDNTLLEPDTQSQEGSDQWFTHLIKTSVLENALNRYLTAVLKTSMRTIEEDTATVFQELSCQCMMLGFTMRSLVLAPCTIAELQKNNLYFKQLISDTGFMLDGKHPVLIYSDCIFCQGQKTGATLFMVLDALGIHPTQILMIDDKRRYLEDIEAACIELDIAFIGLRYGYLDEKVKKFMPV